MVMSELKTPTWTMLSLMSSTLLLRVLCSMAFFQADASDPSGKMSLSDSLGPTLTKGQASKVALRTTTLYLSQCDAHSHDTCSGSLVHLGTVGGRDGVARLERVGLVHGILLILVERDARGRESRRCLGGCLGCLVGRGRRAWQLGGRYGGDRAGGAFALAERVCGYRRVLGWLGWHCDVESGRCGVVYDCAILWLLRRLVRSQTPVDDACALWQAPLSPQGGEPSPEIGSTDPLRTSAEHDDACRGLRRRGDSPACVVCSCFYCILLLDDAASNRLVGTLLNQSWGSRPRHRTGARNAGHADTEDVKALRVTPSITTSFASYGSSRGHATRTCTSLCAVASMLEFSLRARVRCPSPQMPNSRSLCTSDSTDGTESSVTSASYHHLANQHERCQAHPLDFECATRRADSGRVRREGFRPPCCDRYRPRRLTGNTSRSPTPTETTRRQGRRKTERPCTRTALATLLAGIRESAKTSDLTRKSSYRNYLPQLKGEGCRSC